MQPLTADPSGATQPGAEAPAEALGNVPCVECASRKLRSEQYVYVIGRLDVRFPSLGIEREYQQRERALTDIPQQPRNARILAVLDKNPHLASRVTYVVHVGGTPVYAVSPSSGGLKEPFFKALSRSHEPDYHCVAIGRVGPFANPASHGGLLLTAVSVDQLYAFSISEWADSLGKMAEPALKTRNIEADHFRATAQAIFHDVVGMPDNMGISDGHRALNYLLVQHPGLFLAAAERRNHVLDRIETRVLQSVGGRRHVTIILAFVERGTGVPERVYCTVDVTEEWPFISGAEGAAPPLGFAPFVDNAIYASG